uniref:Deleted in malignant brain tumors 1 protein n=1 Tax=Pavo cristatus TaxID=9049 RepID=A0A8C9LAD2_PAVCR
MSLPPLSAGAVAGACTTVTSMRLPVLSAQLPWIVLPKSWYRPMNQPYFAWHGDVVEPRLQPVICCAPVGDGPAETPHCVHCSVTGQHRHPQCWEQTWCAPPSQCLSLDSFSSSLNSCSYLIPYSYSAIQHSFYVSQKYFCGSFLSNSSGTIRSPFYPSNYPDNADCLWEIQVKNNYRIMLTFGSIQLHGGCRYDYIEIYDGPPSTSPLLGRICSGYNIMYTSSSNMMTVRFHSDSRYSNRGFYAEYHSFPADQNTTLFCFPTHMLAVVERSYLQSQGYSVWNASLSDSSCRPKITSTQVIFNIPYNSCGTRRQSNNETFTYSNMIRILASDSIIKRKKDLYFHVNCKMLQKTWVQVMYIADDTGVDNIDETQYGRYEADLAFYDSSSFLSPVYNFPYYVDLNQNLFLQASLHSNDSNLMLFVDTCVASPDPNDFTTLTYDLIRSGCVKDPTYSSYYSPYPSVSRFAFNAFSFVNRYPSVYLQCEMVVCRYGDYSSRCYRGCVSRFRRKAGSSQGKASAVIGPVRLQEAPTENRNAGECKQLPLLFKVGLCILQCVCISVQ